jgi:hypothetical protein
MYLNVFIIYLNIFQCTYNIFMLYFNVPIIYFNAFIVCFNVFQCIYQHCNWISPSLFHRNVLPCTPIYTFFFHSIQWLPSQHAIPLRSIFFHSYWSIPTFIQSILTFRVYTSPHIPHFTFYVVTGCAEYSGA